MLKSASLAERLEGLLARAVGEGDLPGAVALVTDARGECWAGASGRLRVGGAAPMRADTIGWIASMTKPLTTAAVLQAVERGLLALDEPASRWLPALRELAVLEGFEPGGAPRLRPPARPPTLREMLTHTAGFGYDFWSPELTRFQAWRVAAGAAGRDHRYFGFPLLADPGRRWNYGVGIDWAGRVLEAASGMRLGEWFERHLTGPLGMVDTRFGVAPQAAGRVAAMHQRGADGRLVPGDTVPPAAPPWDMGGGGLYGTATDYARFIRFILNRGVHEGERLLGLPGVDAMHGNQIGDQRVVMLRSAQPAMSGDAEFFPGLPKAWTLGFQLNLDRAPTGRAVGSLSWAGLSNCYFWIDPARRIGGVFLAQVLPFADPRALAVFEAFERTVYEAIDGGA